MRQFVRGRIARWAILAGVCTAIVAGRLVLMAFADPAGTGAARASHGRVHRRRTGLSGPITSASMDRALPIRRRDRTIFTATLLGSALPRTPVFLAASARSPARSKRRIRCRPTVPMPRQTPHDRRVGRPLHNPQTSNRVITRSLSKDGPSPLSRCTAKIVEHFRRDLGIPNNLARQTVVLCAWLSGSLAPF